MANSITNGQMDRAYQTLGNLGYKNDNNVNNIKMFQNNTGLPITGTMDYRTWRAIMSAGNKASSVSSSEPTASITPPAGASGGTAPVSYDSYEKFINASKGTYGTILQNAKDTADETRDITYKEAEIERQRGVVDAHSSHAQNKATYGANAEAIADMGLAGSGYSDYINSQAYATQRAEVQGSNAQATYTKRLADQAHAQAYREAEATYQQNVLSADEALAKYQVQKEETHRTNYMEMMQLASEGKLSADQISQIAAKYGFTPEETSALEKTATTYGEKIAADEEQKFTNFEEVDYALGQGIISPEEAKKQKEFINANYSQIVQNYIDSQDYEMANQKLVEFYNSGNINRPTYQSYMGKFAEINIANAVTTEELQKISDNILEWKNDGSITDDTNKHLRMLLASKMNISFSKEEGDIVEKITKNVWYGYGYDKSLSNKKEIRLIQKALAKSGYYVGPIDGDYNEIVREAIKLFQDENSVLDKEDVDAGKSGILEEKTWSHLVVLMNGYFDQLWEE